MRAIWKGEISFGLINIPIELYSAEKRSDLQFKLLDSRNHAKIRYERINEETGEEVPWNEVVKAYEFNDEGYVILEDEDFKRAKIESSQSFEIEDFIEAKNLDCIFFEKPYYLAPTQRGEKGYVLLREILKRTNKVAIGKVVIRTRQYLAALLPHNDILILNLLRFAQELRSAADLHIPKRDLKDYKISAKEIEMAERLVDSMTTEWQPNKYHDDYRDKMLKWIEQKAKLGKIPLPPKEKEEEKGAEIIDFIDLLKKSLKKEGKKSVARGGKRTVKSKSSIKRKSQKK